MRRVDVSNWKPFNIIDLFDLSKGKSKETTTGKPLVTCATSDNGKHKTKVTDNNLVKDVITISGDGVYTGTAFYQGEEVGVFMNVNILTPKFKITKNLGEFCATVLTKSLNPKFHYAKKCGLERLKLERVLLPEKDGQPDFDWIEEFMLKVNKEQEEIRKKLPKYKKGKLDLSTWKPFKITDLFKIKGCSGNIKNFGDFPQISASEFNNGQAGKSTEWKFENHFTVAKDGRPGITFWHPYKFDVNCHVLALEPLFKCTNNIGNFISTVATKSFTPKYHYAKALGIARIQEESILLPEKDGQPDWNYMEEFMNNLTI